MEDRNGQRAEEKVVPVKAKAILIDPESLMISWMNESASETLPNRNADSVSEVTVSQVIPMADTMGIPEALRNVATTGIAQHLQIDLVSTSKGSMVMVVSIYRLPHSELLLVMENIWQAREKIGEGSSSKRSRGRVR